MKITSVCLALLITLLFLPVEVFALDYSDCDAGTIQCTCLPDDPYTIDLSLLTSVEDCQKACSGFADYIDLVHASYEITSFSAQCQIGGTLTALAQGGIEDEIQTTTAASAASSAEADETYTAPALSIEIPGLEFTPATRDGNDVVSNYLGEYIRAAYTWVLTAGSLLAVVMIMLGGLQYMLARGKQASISKAVDRIRHAVVGIILLFGAFSIAQVVDSSLLTFDALHITYIDKSEWYEPEFTDDMVSPSMPISGDVAPIESEHVLNWSDDGYINPEAVAGLTAAGNALFANEGVNIRVTSARRTVQKQAEMFYDNCLSNSSRSCSVLTCNPAGGTGIITGNSSGYTLTGELTGVTDRTTIVNAIVSHANLANCPHTSSVAVDVWCHDGGNNFVHDASCHKALSEAMVANGFCRIDQEAWHFEYDPMHVSGSCKTTNTHSYTVGGKTYTPDLSCAAWDYKNNYCQ